MAKAPQGMPTDEAMRRLFQLCPLLDGAEVRDVTLTTSPTDVEHGLGREPRGFIVTGRNAAATVHQEDSPLAKRLIRLTASATVNVSLWIY